MAELQYIGARYVPTFFDGSSGSEWLPNTQYEPLTIVTRNGNTYTSKKPVTANIGAPESNPEYWVSTGIFNTQIQVLSDKVNELEGNVNDISGEFSTLEGDFADVQQSVGNMETTVQSVEFLAESQPINILSLGAKNDGSADISAIVNQYTSDFAIYLPIGIYRVDNPIELQNALLGAGCNRNNVYNPYGEHTDATVLKSYVQNDYTIKVANNVKGIVVRNLNISLRSGSAAGGITQNTINDGRGTLENIGIYGLGDATGIYINNGANCSRACYLDNISIFGDGHANTSIGVRFSGKAYDSRITNSEIMYVQKGIQIDGGLIYGSDLHVYTGGVASGEITQSYYENTNCVYAPATCMLNFENVYFDSAYRVVNIGGVGCCNITNLMYWDDDTYDSFSASGGYIIFNENRACQVNVSNAQIFNKYKRAIMEATRLINASLTGVQVMVEGVPTAEADVLAYPLYPCFNKSNYAILHTINANITLNNYLQVATVYCGGGGYTSFTVTDVDNNCAEIVVDRTTSTLVHKKTLRGSMDVYYKYNNYILKIYVKVPRTGDQYAVELGTVSAYNGIVQYAQWRQLDHSFPVIESLTSSSGLTSAPELT